MIDPWLLARLVCPVTREPLRYDEAAEELVSEAAGLAYPVRQGVPVLLIREARAIRST
ncbi:Trm112 family protein [soil metagenome]